jgi:hypothetical protein
MESFRYSVGMRLRTALCILSIAAFANNAETSGDWPSSALQSIDSRQESRASPTHVVIALRDDCRCTRGCWAAVKFVMARVLMILSKVNLTFARPSTPRVYWWYSSCESSWLGKPASQLCGANDFGWLGRSVWKNTRPPARRRLHLRLV